MESSGNEADMEEVEAGPLEASPDEEQPAGDLGQSIDAWPSLDQALDKIFAPPAEDWMPDPLAPSQWSKSGQVNHPANGD